MAVSVISKSMRQGRGTEDGRQRQHGGLGGEIARRQVDRYARPLGQGWQQRQHLAGHGLGDARDQAKPLCHRDEAGRRDIAQLDAPPARQRFVADDPRICGVNDRLEDGKDFGFEIGP